MWFCLTQSFTVFPLRTTNFPFLMQTLTSSHLPLFIKGEVINGFGRGSKDLGCPTANFPLEVVQTLPQDFKTGVYYGWAKVDDSPIYKMVANIGWCPFYENPEKSIETHIMHKFDKDFYGSVLKIAIIGYLRQEKNFNSIDELKIAINEDIKNAENRLDDSAHDEIAKHTFFHT